MREGGKKVGRRCAGGVKFGSTGSRNFVKGFLPLQHGSSCSAQALELVQKQISPLRGKGMMYQEASGAAVAAIQVLQES